MSSESENVSSIDRKLFCNVDSTSLLFSLMIERRRGGLMVSALPSGPSGPGSSPGLGHCVVFLGNTLNSHSASLYPGV